MSAYPVSRPLRHFFGAYFHEDWVLEVDDWQRVVDSFVQDEQPSPELLRALTQEINDLIAECTELDVEQLVTRTMGANYCPLPEFTYKEWLAQVAARLRPHSTADDGAATALPVLRADGISQTMDDGSISTDLYQFFAAYFHQDWDLEAGDWQGIVDNYVNADPVAERLRMLAQEIDDMRAARSEADLSQFLLRKVGLCYDPRSEATFNCLLYTSPSPRDRS